MAKSIAFKVFATIVCSICLSASSFANSWWTEPYKRANQDISTLVITSNITMPRIMADLIQYSTRQPYILFPVKSGGKIFLCGAGKDALEIKEGDVTRIINFLNPQQLLILGNKEMFVPKYLKMIPDNQTVMMIYNEDWEMVAKTLSQFFNKPNMYYDFKDLAQEYRGRLYTPTAPKKVELEVIKKDVNLIVTPEAEAQPEAIADIPAMEEKDTPITDIALTAPANTSKTAKPVASSTGNTQKITDVKPALTPAVAPTTSPDEPGIIMPKSAPELIESK